MSDHVTAAMKKEVEELLSAGNLRDVFEKMDELDEKADLDREQLAEIWLLLENTYTSKRKEYIEYFKNFPNYEFPGEREVRGKIYEAFPDYNLGFEEWWRAHPREFDIPPW